MIHKVMSEPTIFPLGELMTPYPGGGDHGVCLKCGKGGLRVIEVEELQPKKPKGWTKISEE